MYGHALHQYMSGLHFLYQSTFFYSDNGITIQIKQNGKHVASKTGDLYATWIHHFSWSENKKMVLKFQQIATIGKTKLESVKILLVQYQKKGNIFFFERDTTVQCNGDEATHVHPIRQSNGYLEQILVQQNMTRTFGNDHCLGPKFQSPIWAHIKTTLATTQFWTTVPNDCIKNKTISHIC